MEEKKSGAYHSENIWKNQSLAFPFRALHEGSQFGCLSGGVGSFFGFSHDENFFSSLSVFYFSSAYSDLLNKLCPCLIEEAGGGSVEFCNVFLKPFSRFRHLCDRMESTNLLVASL